MSKVRSFGILAATVLAVGAAGVPESCQFLVTIVPLQPDVQGILQDTEGQEFATLDFGGLEPGDELLFFGEDPAEFGEEELSDIPQDPALTPDGPPEADRGFLAGRFKTNTEGASSFESEGVFRGVWATADLNVAGFVRGVFHPILDEGQTPGKDDDPNVVAKGVLFGKCVDVEGHFAGILRGGYVKLSDGRSFFAGKWLGEHGELYGAFRGIWRDIEDANGGVFKGHWVRLPFDEEPVEPPDGGFDPGDFGGLTTEDEAPYFGEDPALYALVEAGAPPGGEDPGVPTCPYGWLAGWFRGDNGGPSDAEKGTLRGRWATADGTVVGVLRGWYEPLEDENGGVFYAKCISIGADPSETVGQFRGMIRGRYGKLPDGRGVFGGKWYDRNLVEKGWLHGRWHDIPESFMGVFRGRWVESCQSAE